VTFEEGLDIVEQRSHGTHNRCVVAHRQGVLERAYPDGFGLCDTTHMAHDPEVERVREAVRQLSQRKGLRPKPLAKKAGLGDTSGRDILDNPGRDIKIGTLFKLSTALDVSIEQLVGSADRVPLTGRVGAGGSIVFEEMKDQSAPRPPGMGGTLEALEVQGDSMLPRYSSGDVLYIARTHDGVLEEDIGDYCVARLKSGETFVKLLARGGRPGFYTLRSLNAADMEDVELEWATPIISVLPRAARRLVGF